MLLYSWQDTISLKICEDFQMRYCVCLLKGQQNCQSSKFNVRKKIELILFFLCKLCVGTNFAIHSDWKRSAHLLFLAINSWFLPGLKWGWKSLKIHHFCKKCLNMWGITPQEIWNQNFQCFKKYGPLKSGVFNFI